VFGGIDRESDVIGGQGFAPPTTAETVRSWKLPWSAVYAPCIRSVSSKKARKGSIFEVQHVIADEDSLTQIIGRGNSSSSRMSTTQFNGVVAASAGGEAEGGVPVGASTSSMLLTSPRSPLQLEIEAVMNSNIKSNHSSPVSRRQPKSPPSIQYKNSAAAAAAATAVEEEEKAGEKEGIGGRGGFRTTATAGMRNWTTDPLENEQPQLQQQQQQQQVCTTSEPSTADATGNLTVDDAASESISAISCTPFAPANTRTGSKSAKEVVRFDTPPAQLQQPGEIAAPKATSTSVKKLVRKDTKPTPSRGAEEAIHTGGG